ncbi:MAG: flagellar filament capping protein FliD [Actinobacteria bacterium]|nr:flagellar filament capping protein FliD [Actinomycetota bacterium]
MSSNLRIGGLASGMDIDKMVSDLMKAQRMKVDGIKQNRQLVEWRQVDYRTVNSSLMTLKNTTFNMKLQGTYQAKSATSSNESAVTAAAGNSAAPGIYNVKVTQLAQGVTKGSQSKLAEETNSDGTTKTLAAQFGISGTVSFTLEGKLVDGVRKSQSFDIDTGAHTVSSLVSEINRHSDVLGISASYDYNDNRFFLTTTGTGTDYGINVTSDAKTFLSDANGDGSNTLKLLIKTGALYQGQNAKFDFGDVTNMESKTNTTTVNGITLNLKQGGGATSTISVKSDTNAVYDSIKTFIDQYNTTLGLINGELSEEHYRDYLPLTDGQREQLTETQQKEWDEKAKSGMLRNDNYLSGAAGKMRTVISSVVEGITPVSVDGKKVTHNSLSAVGIVTGLYVEDGKLYLKNNGADLKKAIESDPDGITKLFTNDSTKESERGIAQRLYDELDGAVKGIIEKAGMQSSFSLYDGSALGKKLYDLDKQIARWNDRLNDMEERYWRQFTAMEKAVNRMNAQSAWLSQQLSGDQNKS